MLLKSIAEARKLIERFFPGPLTLVLKKNPACPIPLRPALKPSGFAARQIRSHGSFSVSASCPVAAPSANLSGLPSATSWEAVYEDLDGKIDCLLRGRPSTIGLESTIVDCSGAKPLLLRAGAITLEQLQAVVPEITANHGRDPEKPPKSPA